MHRDTPDRHRLYARTMRKDATSGESLLWQCLRNRQVAGVKFRRQVPLGGYIVDFISFDARLIIEVDGGQHADSRSDAVRDGYFRGQGFRVLRFWNDEVEREIDLVLVKIGEVLRNVGE